MAWDQSVTYKSASSPVAANRQTIVQRGVAAATPTVADSDARERRRRGLPPELVEALDRYAAKIKSNRSAVMRQFLEAGLKRPPKVIK